MEKLVSVIISTYNTDEIFLRKSIESILEQTYKNLQIIIINDGSSNTDDMVIKSYNDNRITYIKHEQNKGLIYSLNEGLEEAKGEYIARMDSDDIATRDRIRIQVDYMEKNKDIFMTSTFFRMIGAENKKIVNSLIKPEEIKCELLYRTPILHPGVMIRSKKLIESKLKYSSNALHMEDFELWTRVAEVGKIAIIPKVCMLYRIHQNQIGNAHKEKQMDMTKGLLESNLNKLGLDVGDVKYLMYLNNGMCNMEINFNDLLAFIEKVESANLERKIYSKKLKNVLKNRVILQIIKYNRRSLSFILKYWNLDTLVFFVKRLYFSAIA